MEAICFDVKAPFASFRIPSTTRGFLTFPFPPRTTIIGLIGAILGEKRNEIYLKDHYLFNARIALQMLNFPNTINFRTNQIQTHSVLTLYKKFKIYIPGDLKRGVRSPQNIVLLKDVHYRIFFGLQNTPENNECLNKIENKLKNHQYAYPPFLGRANYLASIEFIDKVKLNKIGEPVEKVLINTIFTTESVDEINAGSYTIITQVPMSYTAIIKKGKEQIILKPKCLANIVYFEGVIEIKPKINAEFYNVMKSRINNLKGKKIAFLPF
ncbi:MAG: CRISPR-associated protein Cas5 [Candidatus Helarchaeota archaeon]